MKRRDNFCEKLNKTVTGDCTRRLQTIRRLFIRCSTSRSRPRPLFDAL